MVRENMRSPRAELCLLLSHENFRVLVFESGSTPDLRQDAVNLRLPSLVLVLACVRCGVYPGGLAQMAERSLRMRQARGSMPLSSICAHAHRLLPGLVSSVGRAHDS